MSDTTGVTTKSSSIEPPTGRGRERFVMLAAQVGITAAAIVVWHTVVAVGWIHQVVVPYPLDVATSLIELLQRGSTWQHMQVTLVEAIVGFILGSAIGFLLGAVLGTSEFFRRLFFPYIVGFQGLPRIVLAPLFLTILGFGMASKIAMAVALAFFPVLINTMVGLLSVDTQQARLMRSYNASGYQTFKMLTLPTALPFIFAGLKTSLTFALIGAIVGEFVGAREGLGYLLDVFAFRLQVPEVWAIIFILAVLGVVLYAAIEALDRKLIFWREDNHLTTGM